MRILIAEDDFTSRVLIQELLKKYGSSHIAINGQEAVEAVRTALEAKKPYDLICLDIMMPVMDGQTALRQIRELEEARGIISTYGAKIVMVTALDDVKNSMAAFHNLCDGYLVKPINSKLLIAKLRELKLIE